MEGLEGAMETAAVETAEAQNPEQIETAEEGKGGKEPVYTIKVDGKDVQVTLSELQKGYGHSRAANQRLEEAAKMRKEAESYKTYAEQAKQMEQFLLKAQQSPELLIELASQLGHNFDDYFEQRLTEKYKRLAMPESERRLLELQEENAKYKAEQEKLHKSRQAQEAEANEAAAMQAVYNEVSEYFADKQVDQYTIAETLRTALAHMQRGMDISWKDAHAIADRRLNNFRSSVLDTATLDKVPQRIKDELKKAQIESVGKQVRQPQAPRDFEMKPAQKGKAMGYEEYFRKLGVK